MDSALIYPAQRANKSRTLYWVFTVLFVLLDAVPAILFNSQAAVEGIRHLGFPGYFRIELALGKMIGGVLLLLPIVPARLKEWAYVAFGISLISAFIGHAVLDGPGQLIAPVVGLAILLASYVYFHRTKGR